MFGNHYDVALLLVRLVVGSTFILHGTQKVFGLFGGTGLAGFTGWLKTALGVPTWLGALAAYFELLGGISVFFGIVPELGALAIICNMIGAIYLVHGSKGYFIQSGGCEYALNLLLLCIAIIIAGADRFCLFALYK